MRFQKSTTNLPSTKKKIKRKNPSRETVHEKEQQPEEGSIYMNMLKVLNRFYVIILFACEPIIVGKSHSFIIY